MAKSSRDKKRAERFKRIGKICENINKGQWGGDNKDACLFLGGGSIKSIERFPCGAKTLDVATGGGYPRGRVIEIYGPESGGKSTLVLHAIAEFQKKYPDEDVALIDSEFSFDIDYAKRLNVDVDLLIVHQPESGEQAMNVLEQLVENGVRLIAVDSVAALTTIKELEGEIGDAHVAQQARLMSGSLKRLVGKVGRSVSTVIFTNQVREKIGVTWGDKTTQPGGRALKFYASIRVEVVRIGSDTVGSDENKVRVANRVKATITKNKVAPPFKVANFVISYGHGIDSVAAILEAGLEQKILKKSGSWFSYGETRLGQGKTKALDFLRENEDILKEIEEKLDGPAEEITNLSKAEEEALTTEEAEEEASMAEPKSDLPTKKAKEPKKPKLNTGVLDEEPVDVESV